MQTSRLLPPYKVSRELGRLYQRCTDLISLVILVTITVRTNRSVHLETQRLRGLPRNIDTLRAAERVSPRPVR